MPEIVYVLTNEAMPNIVKIGKTTDSVKARLSALNSHSGVPLPFECYFAAEVENCTKTEGILHKLFSDNRINPKREFFSIEPEKIVLAISLGDFTDVTEVDSDIDADDAKAINKSKSKRSRIKLSAIGINVGDTLSFSRDDAITVSVTEENKVTLNGEVMSLSASALKIFNDKGYKTTSVSGSDYWMFEGELLDERRKRIEADSFED
jgi:hypothetical protein